MITTHEAGGTTVSLLGTTFGNDSFLLEMTIYKSCDAAGYKAVLNGKVNECYVFCFSICVW